MNTTTTLRILRESRGFSQEYVGSVLGIEQNTYSKLENGQIRLTVDRLNALAELYEIPVDILLSKELPVVNYNNGQFSKGIVNAEKFISTNADSLYEKLLIVKDQVLEEKEKQIETLKNDLSEQKAEKHYWKEKYLNLRNNE